MKPSDIRLGAPPLVGTFGVAEAEAAGALMVRTCQVLGDQFQAVHFAQVMKVWDADVEASRPPFAALRANPFFRPFAYELVRRGFARWTDKEGGPLEFTAKGIDALKASAHYHPGI